MRLLSRGLSRKRGEGHRKELFQALEPWKIPATCWAEKKILFRFKILQGTNAQGFALRAAKTFPSLPKKVPTSRL
jgi:hypothetical protein